jgi:hypothetical protein
MISFNPQDNCARFMILITLNLHVAHGNISLSLGSYGYSVQSQESLPILQEPKSLLSPPKGTASNHKHSNYLTMC